ncbi:hypothetical protein H0H87_012037 [Tephrocybe sp. NHM501043]|nr:hypothetical protein H0H87_012037 [Tephrocybe sp. NHM501043]
MPPVDLTVKPETATPSDNAVVELPALENEGDSPLLFQEPVLQPASPPSSPEHIAMPPLPPAPPAALMPVPGPQPCRNRARNSPQPIMPPASPPLALRHSKRQPQAPHEWWKVEHKPAVQESSDEESEPTPDEFESDPKPLDPGYEDVQFAGMTSSSDPRTYKQAMQSGDGSKWNEAVSKEWLGL